jgi:uncharacterized protein (DUF2147 family)
MSNNGERIIVLALCFSFLAATAVVWAAKSDDVLGQWYNEEHDGIIEIYKCADKYCGKIVWAKEPDYPANDKMSRSGQRRVDDKNPDPNLRKRPIIGLKMMSGFIFDGTNKWKSGSIYDPKNGKTYGGTLTLISQNKLHLSGYVLFSFLRRTTTWTRVNPGRRRS